MTPPSIAVHDLGGTGPITFYADATGFHALCWQTVAARLPGMHNIAYDARGHGDTPIGDDWDDGVDWTQYGGDARDLAVRLAADGGPVLGVGHSMGGAALLMAALDRPDAFRGLVVYEPIVMPPGFEATSGNENFLASGARRRRSTFASFDEALTNYGGKPPLNIFTPESLEAYVRGGFRLGEDGQVHLKCTPEHEARTYEAAGGHHTWDRLRDMQVPVWVVNGQPQEGQPSSRTKDVAAEIPGSRYIELDHLSHFGPMQSPAEVADIVAEANAAF